MKNKSILIIFNLKKREKYIYRYINILSHFVKSYDILIINNSSIKIDKTINSKTFKIIIKNEKKNLKGMADFFGCFFKYQKILNQYRYAFFCDDDNFIFPDSIKKCEDFLNKNKNYIGASGKGFLFSEINRKFQFLNVYNLSNFNSKNLNSRIDQYNKHPAINFYSLIRVKNFLAISKSMRFLKDDNLAELLLNILILLSGNIKSLKEVFLARRYPRPQIYNIPKKNIWFSNENLIKEINLMIKLIKKFIKTNYLNIKFQIVHEKLIISYIAERLKQTSKKKLQLNFIEKIIIQNNKDYKKFKQIINSYEN